jgi:hypothetical protein
MSPHTESGPTPIDLVDDIPRAAKALREAVQEALWRHKLAGASVAVWRDGRVVWIPPEEIPDPPWVKKGA